MSKTFYANGNTGVVAIIEGENISIIDDPYNNTDSIYFHSDFNYLKYEQTVSGSVSMPASSGYSSISTAKVALATISWDTSLVPVVFFKINGFDVCGDRIFAIDYTELSGSLRYLASYSGYTKLLTSSLEIGVSQFKYDRPAQSLTVSADIYSLSLQESSRYIEITQDRVIFSGGKFDSNNNYLFQKLGGFKLPTDRTLQIATKPQNITFPYVELIHEF